VSRIAGSKIKQGLENPEKAFFRGFRQKSADAEGAKAHSLRELYAGAEAPAS
jgi:hypothetical protein